MYSSTAATPQQQPDPKSHPARSSYHFSPDSESGETNTDTDNFYDTNSSRDRMDAPIGGVERSCIADDGTASEDIFTSLAIDQFAALLQKEQRYASARVHCDSNSNSNNKSWTNVNNNGNDCLRNPHQSRPLSPHSDATTNSNNPNPSPTSTSAPNCNSSVPLHEIYRHFAKESGYEEGERYENMPTSTTASARISPTTSSTRSSCKSTSENRYALNTRMSVRASVAKYVTMVLDHYHQHREILHVVMSYLDAFFCKRYQQQHQHQSESQNHQHQNKSQYEYHHHCGSQTSPEVSSQQCVEFWTVILVAIDLGIQLYSPCSGDGYRACRDYVLQVQEEQRQQQKQSLESSFDTIGTEDTIAGAISNSDLDLDHDEEALHKRVKKVFRQSGNFYQYYHFTTLMDLARMANITVAVQVPTHVQSPTTHRNRAPLRDLQSTPARTHNASSASESTVTVTSPITKDNVAVVQSTLLTTLDFYLHPTTPTRILQTLLQALEVDIIKVVMACRDEDESMMAMMQESYDVGDNYTSTMSVEEHVMTIMDKLGQNACGQTDIIFYHDPSRPKRTHARTQNISSPSNSNSYNNNHSSNIDLSGTSASIVAMASMVNAIHGTFPEQYANYLCDQMRLVYENALIKLSLLSLPSELLPKCLSKDEWNDVQIEIASVGHILLDLLEKKKVGTLFHTLSHTDENGYDLEVDLEGEETERNRRDARSPVSVSDRSVPAIGEDGAKLGNGRNNGVRSDLGSEICANGESNYDTAPIIDSSSTFVQQSKLHICAMESYDEGDPREGANFEEMNLKNSSLHSTSHSRHLAPKPETDPIVHDLYKEFSVPLPAASQTQLYEQPYSNDLSYMYDQANTTVKPDLAAVSTITSLTGGVKKHCIIPNLAIAPDAKTDSFDPTNYDFSSGSTSTSDAWIETVLDTDTKHFTSTTNRFGDDTIADERTAPESSSDSNMASIHSDSGVGGEYISTFVSLACCCSRSRSGPRGKNHIQSSRRSRRQRSNSESSSSIYSDDDSNSINSAKRIEHKLGKINLDGGRRKRAKHGQYQPLEEI